MGVHHAPYQTSGHQSTEHPSRHFSRTRFWRLRIRLRVLLPPPRLRCADHASHEAGRHYQTCRLFQPRSVPHAQHSTKVIAYGHPLIGLSRHLRPPPSALSPHAGLPSGRWKPGSSLRQSHHTESSHLIPPSSSHRLSIHFDMRIPH